jgi:hypothetical protein
MRRTESDRQRRALRLLRWYPAEWRARYGDEFLELLVADMDERPRSLARTLDVARSGFAARAAAAGLAGHSLDRAAAERRRVAASPPVSAFLVFALAVWAQLTIGWQWAPPDTVATSLAMVVMSVAIVVCGLLCFAGATPIVWSAARALRRGQSRHVFPPLLVIGAGLLILVLGTHHFANGWPGTGGHPWVRQGIVPGGVAAYAWASTLFVTSYWAHPAALDGFPASEVAWMILSPIALTSMLIASARVVRRLDLSPRLLRYERHLLLVVTLPMACFFTGAAMWVFDGGPGPRNLFHIGAIDFVDLAVLALATVLLGLAGRRVSDSPGRFSVG